MKFWRWVSELFSRKILIVELKPQVRVFDEDAEAAIASLKGHPGWELLMDKLRLQRQYLIAELEQDNGFRKDLRIKEGIRWNRWLERQVDFASKSRKSKRVEIAPPDIMDEFYKINAAMVRVGTPQEESEVPQG